MKFTLGYNPDIVNTYWVYIMASVGRVLYVGVTNDLKRRYWAHFAKETMSFTSRYNVTRLVYFEDFTTIEAAIAREKAIKNLLRAKKIALIETMNPDWRDYGPAL